EKIQPTESSKERQVEQIHGEMDEYLSGLIDLAKEKQQELNQLLQVSGKERNNTKIEGLKSEIEEINSQIEEMQECLQFMEEEGDDLEIEIDPKKP
ncbi:unnamed protein product, partial [marine sediment metagenome]